MALAIAITDNANATATVTVSGSSGGTVQIRRHVYGPDGNEGSEFTVGTRVGDGTLIIAGAGYWNWYAYINGSTYTSEVYVRVTVGGDSIYDRCLDMLKDRIESLDLDGLDTVYVNKVAPVDIANLDFPCVMLTLADQAEEKVTVENMRDDITYTVSVTILDRIEAADNSNRGRFLHWRRRIERAIDNQRWDYRVPTVWKCETRPAQVVASAETTGLPELTQGGLIVACISREYRGVAA